MTAERSALGADQAQVCDVLAGWHERVRPELAVVQVEHAVALASVVGGRDALKGISLRGTKRATKI